MDPLLYAREHDLEGPTPSGFTSAMIGAIMGDACDRLPVVMLINAVIRFFCFSFVWANCSQLSNWGWAIEAVGRGRSLFIAGRSHYLRSGISGALCCVRCVCPNMRNSRSRSLLALLSSVPL